MSAITEGPVSRTGSPQGFSLVEILHKLDYLEYNAKHAHYTNVKHQPKVISFGIALVKKKAK